MIDNLIFPIYKNKELLNTLLESKDMVKILLLEELWLEDTLHMGDSNYVLNYRDLYNMDIDSLKILGLPYDNDIEIFLKSRNYLGGNTNFHIEYSLSSVEYGNLDGFYERIENIIFFDNKRFLLFKEQVELLNEIDGYNANNLDEQGLFLAKVKKKRYKS